MVTKLIGLITLEPLLNKINSSFYVSEWMIDELSFYKYEMHWFQYVL